MHTTKNYDVAIIGGGMVGLATAIGLAMESLSVVVINAGSEPSIGGDAKLRVSAINQASQRLLTRLGAWGNIDMSRISPYQKMQVWDKDSLGKNRLRREHHE